MNTQADKWDRVYSRQECTDVNASDVLIENAHLLPKTGKSLDLACGLGGNAILLAQHNLQVTAWDISSNAINKLSKYAQTNTLDITASLCDVEKQPPTVNSFDVVTVANFLHRPTFHNLINCLRINGLLYYQTFIRDKVSSGGPSNPDYLLNENELLDLCHGLQILVYREEGSQGDIEQGWRNQAMIVAIKIA